MEVEKSHNMPSASWRTRKTSDIIQSSSEGLRTKTSEVQVEEKVDIPAQEETMDSAFLCFLFYWALNRLEDAHPL